MNAATLSILPNGAKLGTWGNRVWYLEKRTLLGNYRIAGINGFNTIYRSYSAFQLIHLTTTKPEDHSFAGHRAHIATVKNLRRI